MAPVKIGVVLAVVALLAAIAGRVEAAQCNGSPAMLASCLPATQSSTSYPGAQCCSSLTRFRGNPDCLCSTMLTARQQFTFSVPNAFTIPERCGYANEIPPHYKCGNYVVGH
ncbi:hypothetical protein SELMODRAFT_415515 [Selaginella moellendorffii]|uniref:Bifunctional inhibitor/plant lipid transfer protein/seed storage helical domain-containing protein n=1 Tax=Selaginella moellendorffii TaxID=88036 RepID=D8RWD2_SELML|nr:uncharacterized protein LOC9629578 [Selaginella moellendorffii]EFJ23650.1 hypothetical protein SELMODRAFT_415515 [Selaginella moellendorffii]|eukprot:XP_002975449.1 uncharacterized protein LOC9629578 [Selaginella moellendorffii]